MIWLTLPIRAISEANARDHWAKKAKRVKLHRNGTGFAVAVHLRETPMALPVDVHLTRQAPSGGLDGDNLVSSLKAVRDGVADALGVKDNDPRVTWHYAQAKSGKRGLWGVEIRIVARVEVAA